MKVSRTHGQRAGTRKDDSDSKRPRKQNLPHGFVGPGKNRHDSCSIAVVAFPVLVQGWIAAPWHSTWPGFKISSKRFSGGN